MVSPKKIQDTSENFQMKQGNLYISKIPHIKTVDFFIDIYTQRQAGCCHKIRGQKECWPQTESSWAPSCEELSLGDLMVGNAHSNSFLEVSRENNDEKSLSLEI